LAANNRRAFLGEFNAVVDANNNNECRTAVYAVLDHLRANRNQWLGFAVVCPAPHRTAPRLAAMPTVV
jgi:hypothetical protein